MGQTIMKECKKHGMTEFVLRSDGAYRCKKCAAEAVQRRRDKNDVETIIKNGYE